MPKTQHRMRLIVAGGRDYRLTVRDLAKRRDLCERLDVPERVHGDANGVDRDAGAWGKRHHYVVTPFPAEWENHEGAAKRSQGAIRNRKMAAYADAVVLFQGGDGTADMRKAAVEHNLRVYDYRPEATNRKSLWQR
mgnify:CR=1 FL=1